MNQAKWDFTGTTAVVTGGSGGIGSSIVRALAQAGAKVMFTYSSDQQAAQALAEQCNVTDKRVEAIQANFTSEADLDRLLRQLADVPVDCLVNNAGMLRDGPLYKMPDADWRDVLQVNLHAMFAVTKKLIPILAPRAGSIVNISSVSGISGAAGQVNYSTAKAGVHGFTRALAREVGPLGVRVNAIAPGFVDTDMLLMIKPQKKRELHRDIPLRRLGKPQDIAETALFLLSESASYMTGAIVVVDGGLY
ncbi:SDR family NAD(P)-dependent oxidoreductase [Xylanibacillus composti]|uniref:Beta-ketoacyl-ACP reductase n=1 Tax=Xylanibacillus composti TaxID=1572762 RepID=A0A8J4M4Z8_9BACL|nr:SDR family NAD(P)-dependent oxidoreductase [Xylanibacillus composti]MDT9726760.1 SDR family NAD(P)-dependent oxidoreductase [Xylanibacillus composti]GIQ71466.1 beta-ketoacyl-ACP reductase [Xylanibacillus composti]